MIYKITKQKKITLTLLSFACCIQPSFAAKQIDLSRQIYPVHTSKYLAAARSNDNSLFKVVSSHTDDNATTHTRIQQTHSNIPVWGADAVMHIPANKKHGYMWNKPAGAANLIKDPSIKKNGVFYSEIEKDIGTIAPQNYLQENSKSAVVNFLKQEFLKKNSTYTWQIQNETVEPIVYVDENNKSHWTYQVSFTAYARNHIPKQPIAIIDAENYKIYETWNNIKRFKDSKLVSAIGFGGNPLLGQWKYGQDKPSLSIMRNLKTNTCFMSNDDVTVYKVDNIDQEKGTVEPGKPYSFNCSEPDGAEADKLLVPEKGFYGQFNEGYSPINDALYYGNVLTNMYKEWYGVHILTEKKNHTQPLKLKMNILDLGYNFENAFWHSEAQQMYFGLGGDSLFPFITLGVAAHEITHGFTDQNSNLFYANDSGAINEAFSDMAIAAATYYASNEKESEWSTGWELLKSNFGRPKEQWESIRYFDTPSKDNYSLEHASGLNNLKFLCKTSAEGDIEKYQDCFVHLASGIFNKAFYLLTKSSGWNVKSAFKLMIKANQDYWTPISTFDRAACGVKHAADDMKQKDPNLNIQAVADAFEAVGLSFKSC